VNEDETLFQQKRPQIPLDAALRIVEEYGDMVSMDGRIAAINHFLVAFVSKKGDLAGPLMLNAVVARELCRLLIANGYGPKTADQIQ